MITKDDEQRAVLSCRYRDHGEDMTGRFDRCKCENKPCIMVIDSGECWKLKKLYKEGRR